jgi:hypothetical protein
MGLKTLSTECTFAILTYQRKKTLKDMLAFRNQAYYEWILKNSFYLSS